MAGAKDAETARRGRLPAILVGLIVALCSAQAAETEEGGSKKGVKSYVYNNHTADGP